MSPAPSTTTALTSATTKEPKKPQYPSYAAIQTYEIEGQQYKLTFVKGDDTRRMPRYKDEHQTSRQVPANILDQYGARINWMRVECFTAAHLEITDEDVDHDSWGVSFCSKTEPLGYSWKRGCRKALADALSKSGVIPSTRKALWEKFNERNKPPGRRQKTVANEIYELTDTLAASMMAMRTIPRVVQQKIGRSSSSLQKMVPLLHWLIAEK